MQQKTKKKMAIALDSWKYKRHLEFILSESKNIGVRCKLCGGNTIFSTLKTALLNLKLLKAV